MLENFVTWIKELWRKMIGREDIKRELGIDLQISSPMLDALGRWSAMYENKAEWIQGDIHSTNLPAAIAGELARSATIEMQVEVTGSERADYLAAQLAAVVEDMREQVEYGCAKGGLILKPWPNGQELQVDYVQADGAIPVRFSGRRLVECIFVDKRKQGDSFYTRLEFHQLLGKGNYRVTNKAFKSTTESSWGNRVELSEVEDWADLQPETNLRNIKQPLFAYFRFPQANNIDPSSPLGVSCYARAEDLIKQADIQWSRLLWEMESGERAMYVDELALEKDEEGRSSLPLKKLYRGLNASGEIGKSKLFDEWTPNLREQNFLNALDAILKKVETNCGLAFGTLSNPQTVEKTATETLAAKQRSAATIADTQKAVRKAMDQLLYAMDTWVTLYNLAPKGKYEAAYTFDDSLITDRHQQFVQDTQVVSMGAMAKVEFRMRTYGESEDVARKKVEEAQKERAEAASLFPEEE